MVYIYVLSLEQNKYYIGKTNNINFRLDQHFNSNGSEWTKRFHPLALVELIPNCDSFDEDKYTKIYMNKYGIDNVRGGSYCQIKLSINTIETLKKELNGANDKCYTCGQYSHFSKDCRELMCYRCGRSGHLVNKCYANTHIEGKSLNGCYNCGRDDHWKINCNYNVDIYGKKIEKGFLATWFNF